MEQRCDSAVTAEEIEVANIFLELSHMIFASESRRRFYSTWGAKRKRSAASKQEVAVAAISSPALKLSPPPPTPPYPQPSLPSNVVGSTFETEGPIEKVLTSSPATPLSFPPSESDEKPLLSKKKPSVNNIKKKKEQLLEIIEDFTWRNELLKKDVENKKRFLDQQKSENLELKAKKRKLCHTLPKEDEPRIGTSSKSLNLELELTQMSMEIGNTITGSCQDYHHQQQISTRVYQPLLIMDQLASNSNPEMNKNSEYPFGRMICWLPPSSTIGGLSKLHDNVCPPLGPLDLNVSAEEALGSLRCSSLKSVDQGTVADTKARAAQARLKRMQICRSKNYNAARKPHHPFR